MFLIQPPGELREQHLGEVRLKQSFIKDKITGRVNILWRSFEKVKNKVTGPEKPSF